MILCCIDIRRVVVKLSGSSATLLKNSQFCKPNLLLTLPVQQSYDAPQTEDNKIFQLPPIAPFDITKNVRAIFETSDTQHSVNYKF